MKISTGTYIAAPRPSPQKGALPLARADTDLPVSLQQGRSAHHAGEGLLVQRYPLPAEARVPVQHERLDLRAIRILTPSFSDQRAIKTYQHTAVADASHFAAVGAIDLRI